MASVVGLTLLEVIRRQDLPKEILEAENPTVTMPRKLGLSDVIDRQIRIYQEEVRKGRRMSDQEVHDLVKLVTRRPDSEEVLFRAGRILAGENGSEVRGLRRLLPRGVALGLARRSVRRRIKKLFGRDLGRFEDAPFEYKAGRHLLLESDPGGDACHLVTGLGETIVQRFTGAGFRLIHAQCISRADDQCRWTILEEERSTDVESVPDFLLNPELGAG